MAAAHRRNSRKALIASAVALPLLLLAGIFFITAAADGPGEKVATSIPDVAPGDADTLVIAPFTESWWNQVSAMSAPDIGVAGIDPASAPAIESIGYSRSPDRVEREVPFTGALRLFYLESPTRGEAVKLTEWLQQQDGFSGEITQLGRVLVVGQSWVSNYEPPVKVMADVEDYDAGVTTERASMWMNTDREIEALAGPAGEAATETYTDVIRHGFGFTEDTTWIGYSQNGADWKGDFISGGVDGELIDFKAARTAVKDTEKQLAETETEVAKMRIIAPGMSELLSVSSFSSSATAETLGTHIEADFPAVEDPLVTAVQDVTAWNYGVTGTYSYEENITSRAVSANEQEMMVSLGYAGNG